MSPVETQSRLKMAIARLDAANTADPKGREVDYANRLSAWVHRLDPAPAEALQLAARAQHLQRWLIPRESYPSNRVGYLQWRADLKQFHAQQAGAILVEVGYDETTVTAVQDLALDLAPASFGELRRSTDLGDDPIALRQRLAEDGYLYLPGYLDQAYHFGYWRPDGVGGLAQTTGPIKTLSPPRCGRILQ